MNDARSQSLLEAVVTRAVNPVGFVAGLLLFLFVPCVAMSWELRGLPALDQRLVPVLDVSSTGADIAIHQPRIHWNIAVRALAIATLIVIAVGAGTAGAGTARRRSLAAAIVATLSCGLLAATALLGVRWLEGSQRRFLSLLFSTVPKNESAGVIGLVDDAGGLRAGFWLALAVFAVLAALNVVVLVRDQRPTGGLE